MAPQEGPHNRGLQSPCHHFTHYCRSLSPDPMRYCGLVARRSVAKKSMNKYKCPKHLEPAPPKNLEEAHQLLDKCETPWMLPGCYSMSHTPTCQDSGFRSRGLGTFPNRPVHITPLKANSNPGEASWDTLEKKAATYEEG